MSVRKDSVSVVGLKTLAGVTDTDDDDANSTFRLLGGASEFDVE